LTRRPPSEVPDVQRRLIPSGRRLQTAAGALHFRMIMYCVNTTRRPVVNTTVAVT